MTSTAILPFPLTPTLSGDVTAAEPLPSPSEAMGRLTDQALVGRTAQGDTDAFAALYRRYERPIFALLLRMSGRRAVAEEWLQETFTRVWLAAGTHDPARGQVRPWIYTIALNTARSELALKRSRASHLSLDETGIDLPDDGQSEARTAQHLDEARRKGAVARALAALPAYMREVIVLRCGRDLTFAEIAEVTGAPEGTIKSRFHRAVAALREALGAAAKRPR